MEFSKSQYAPSPSNLTNRSSIFSRPFIPDNYTSHSGSYDDSQLTRRTLFYISLFTVSFGFFLGFFLGPLLDNVSNVSLDGLKPLTSSSSSRTSITIPIIEYYNNYTLTRPLTEDYPWEHIVEPYRLTYFFVTNPVEGYIYRWYIDGWHKEDGIHVPFLFTDGPGTYYTITLEMKRKGGEIVAKTELEVISKYVRREIRSLTDQDREALFNSIAIMQRVPTQVGKKLYGKNYRSKDFFNRIHLYYGGSKSCDHWHQGPGFVTSHITFEIMYEKSVQAINPSVTLPYWDFTLESTFYTPYTFRNSGVFSDDWFGDARCNNTYHTPTTGRFSYVPTMRNAQNYSLLLSPYGLLRSPWNVDPAPYMTRSDTIFGLQNNLKPSGCAEYHRSMTFHDWKNLAKQLNSNAHGHIHELMGGSWNPYKKVDTPSSDTGLKEAYEFLHSSEAFSKILWRYGYLECPETPNICSLDQDESDCECKCVDFDIIGYTKAHVLSSTGIIKSMVFYDKEGNPIENWLNHTSKIAYETLPGYTYDETQEIYDDIMDILCHPGHIGDMFQATSTNDITFWVLHPTLDRLWHRMRLNHHYGLIDFDDTWPDQDATCDGHFYDGTTPFKSIFDSNEQVYTNGELYDILDPSLDSFPYIYDHFRWSHCHALGYDMSGTEG